MDTDSKPTTAEIISYLTSRIAARRQSIADDARNLARRLERIAASLDAGEHVSAPSFGSLAEEIGELRSMVEVRGMLEATR